MNETWVAGAETRFPLSHLPYGVFSRESEPPRVGVAVGDSVLDLGALAGQGLLEPVADFSAPALNSFMAAGPDAWRATRARLVELLTTEEERTGVAEALVEADAVRLHLPFAVADYVDFYSSRAHAENLGRLFRPGSDPLTPNWLHLPIGYHGRAGTVVVSGTPVVRPSGQIRPPDAERPVFRPSARLDIELELGFVVGVGSELGSPVDADAAPQHLFGAVLVNDWSARDIQSWEYQPLGPFLGKSFATSIAAWVTPLEALEPFRVPAVRQDPEPLPHLRAAEPTVFDLDLEVGLAAAGMREFEAVSRTSARNLYWTVEQQVAHLTSNGTNLRTGDLLASGTISGPEPGARGSFIELSWNGAEPVKLGDGRRRTFLEDGDEVVLRGRTAGAGGFALGDVRGAILPARGDG
ncbi:MAG: fumarylacetoacetase [Thermoleophilia bacterium]|nr:fumarylacetoacetase [Thermoleophilia bacterium]